MMKQKKIIMLLLIIISFVVCIENVNAAGIGVPAQPGPSGGSGGGPSGGDGGSGGGSGSGGSCYVVGESCNPQASIPSNGTGSSYYWDFYDFQNNLIEDFDNTNILAGTSIGINLYEQRMAYWTAYGSTIVTYQCKHIQEVPVYGCANEDCSDYTVVAYWAFIYYTTHTAGEWRAWCQDIANNMGYNLAKAEVEVGATFSLSVSDPNDARCAEPEKYKEELASDGVECQNYNVMAVPGETSPPLSNPVTKNYYYEMSSACINVKTAKVRYLSSVNDSCDSEEIYIENEEGNNKHWHIFTPLNTKETKDYTFELTPDTNKTEIGNLCQRYVEKYQEGSEYMKYIKPTTGNFTGIPSIDKQLVKKECYMYMSFTLNISQKFYNEVKEDENNSSLVGFDFYYKPIDINNPFPNGITDDSYWKLWSESSKKTPDLTKSFDTLTYTAYNIDGKAVRAYNQKNKNIYTSWHKMNLDGTSNYIKESGFITRNPEALKDEIYNLGCGPANKDWEECKR